MSRDLPPWFTEAWVVVLIPKNGRKRRHITYWTRVKYDHMVRRWRDNGAAVLYGIHISRGLPRR